MNDISKSPTPSAQINPRPRIRQRPQVIAPEGPEAASMLVPTISNDTYKVGYGKPPEASRFRKGVSGNPKGRPKKAKGLNTIVREQLLEPLLVRTERGERRVPRVQALFMKLIEKAAKGELRALEKLLHLYATAVPELVEPAGTRPSVEQLSAADESALALLRQVFAEEDSLDIQKGDGQ